MIIDAVFEGFQSGFNLRYVEFVAELLKLSIQEQLGKAAEGCDPMLEMTNPPNKNPSFDVNNNEDVDYHEKAVVKNNKKPRLVDVHDDDIDEDTATNNNDHHQPQRSKSKRHCRRTSKNKKKKTTSTTPNNKRKSTSKKQPHQEEPDPIPEVTRNAIAAMGGTNMFLVIQKELQGTDISRGHNRLSIPLNQVRRKDFLTEDEKEALASRDEKGKNARGMEVKLVEPDGQFREAIMLKRWDMKKESGACSSMYVLIKIWNDVVLRNGLRAGTRVQVWSFRVDSVLHLALAVTKSAVTVADDEQQPQTSKPQVEEETSPTNKTQTVSQAVEETNMAGEEAYYGRLVTEN